MSFANLKRNRNSIADLVSAGVTNTEKKNYGDDRQWKATVDKAGNGYAVLRFLPAPEGNETPWARFWDHGFKGPTGQWMIERSLTSIGQPCPISEANSALWNSGNEDDKNIARDRKRRLHYVSNVLIVSDPSNPSNEGKVMLYTFGKKIHDKIMDVMQPQFQDEAPLNPYDMWEGADFKLKIRNVEGYRDYGKSEFGSQSALLDGDDEKLEELYAKTYDLSEYTDPSEYKTYEELSARLALVLGETRPVTAAHAVALDTQSPAPAPASAPQPAIASTAVSDDDDTMAYFSSLAAED